MRFISALFLVALFGALNANKAVFHELAQINKHPFGATMLAAISTNLRAKTPLSDVSDLLNQILNDLLTDSQTLDNNYQQVKSDRQADIDNSNNLIGTFQDTISQLQDTIAAYETEGLSRVSDYATVTGQITATQDDLDTLQSDYASQQEDFSSDINNLNDAIAACNTALDKMNTYQSATGAALIQVASAAKTHLSSFSAKMKEMSHKLSKHGTMYAPLIHELVELTQDVSDDSGSQVVDLLNQLLNLLIDALADLKNQAASYQANYQNHLDQDNAALAAFQAQADTDSQRVQEISVQETQAIANLDRNEQFLSDAETVLANAEAAYQANEDNYADQRPRYDELISILETLINHFNQNVAAVDEWTASQINGEN